MPRHHLAQRLVPIAATHTSNKGVSALSKRSFIVLFVSHPSATGTRKAHRDSATAAGRRASRCRRACCHAALRTPAPWTKRTNRQADRFKMYCLEAGHRRSDSSEAATGTCDEKTESLASKRMIESTQVLWRQDGQRSTTGQGMYLRLAGTPLG